MTPRRMERVCWGHGQGYQVWHDPDGAPSFLPTAPGASHSSPALGGYSGERQQWGRGWPPIYPTQTCSSEFASRSELLPKTEGQSPAQGGTGLETGSISSMVDAEHTLLGIFGFAKYLNAGI